MNVSYSAIRAVCQPDAMARLLAERVIAPALPSVLVKEVRAKEGRRLEAPRVLWNVYEATLETPEGSEVRPLFWTKAFFEDGDCTEYRESVGRLLSGRGGNPLDPRGFAQFIPEHNLFLFFFPSDPVFPALRTVFDAVAMKPLLVGHFERLQSGTSQQTINCIRVKYLPEISCIVRYEANPGVEKPLAIYGKVQHSKRGALTYEVMKALWDLPSRANGELVLAQPLGYYPRYSLLLQSALSGDDVKGDRHSEVFMAQCEAAGRTIGHIHNSGIKVGSAHTVDVEIERLDRRLEQFKLAAPRVYFLLRDLLKHIKSRAGKVSSEAPVPSHGDFKYNQFLYDGRNFGLIDVEYFVQAEPSFDLGKYCGHLAPSSPKHWSDTAQANEARRLFLEAYLAVRPEYRGARFSIYEALSLATRALVVMWSQSGDWQYAAETLVALAFERLKTPWGE